MAQSTAVERGSRLVVPSAGLRIELPPPPNIGTPSQSLLIAAGQGIARVGSRVSRIGYGTTDRIVAKPDDYFDGLLRDVLGKTGVGKRRNAADTELIQHSGSIDSLTGRNAVDVAGVIESGTTKIADSLRNVTDPTQATVLIYLFAQLLGMETGSPYFPNKLPVLERGLKMLALRGIQQDPEGYMDSFFAALFDTQIGLGRPANGTVSLSPQINIAAPLLVQHNRTFEVDEGKQQAELVADFLNVGGTKILERLRTETDPRRASLLIAMLLQMNGQDPQTPPLKPVGAYIDHGLTHLYRTQVDNPEPFFTGVTDALTDPSTGVGGVRVDTSPMVVEMVRRTTTTAVQRGGLAAQKYADSAVSTFGQAIRTTLNANQADVMAVQVGRIIDTTSPVYVANVVQGDLSAHAEQLVAELAQSKTGLHGPYAPQVADRLLTREAEVVKRVAAGTREMHTQYLRGLIDSWWKATQEKKLDADLSAKLFDTILTDVVEPEGPFVSVWAQRESGTEGRETRTGESLRRYLISLLVGQQFNELGVTLGAQPQPPGEGLSALYMYLSSKKKDRPMESTHLAQIGIHAAIERLLQTGTDWRAVRRLSVGRTDNLVERLSSPQGPSPIEQFDLLLTTESLSPATAARVYAEAGAYNALSQAYRRHNTRVAAALDKEGGFYAKFEAGGLLAEVSDELGLAMSPGTSKEDAFVRITLQTAFTEANKVGKHRDKYSGLADVVPGPAWISKKGVDAKAAREQGFLWGYNVQLLLRIIENPTLVTGGEDFVAPANTDPAQVEILRKRHAKLVETRQATAASALYIASLLARRVEGEDETLKAQPLGSIALRESMRKALSDRLVTYIAYLDPEKTQVGRMAEVVVSRSIPDWPIEDQRYFVRSLISEVLYNNPECLRDGRLGEILTSLALRLSVGQPAVRGERDRKRLVAQVVGEGMIEALQGYALADGQMKRGSVALEALGMPREVWLDPNPQKIGEWFSENPHPTISEKSMMGQAINVITKLDGGSKARLYASLADAIRSDVVRVVLVQSAGVRFSPQAVVEGLGMLSEASEELLLDSSRALLGVISLVAGYPRDIQLNAAGALDFEANPALPGLVAKLQRQAQSEYARLREGSGQSEVEAQTRKLIGDGQVIQDLSAVIDTVGSTVQALPIDKVLDSVTDVVGSVSSGVKGNAEGVATTGILVPNQGALVAMTGTPVQGMDGQSVLTLGKMMSQLGALAGGADILPQVLDGLLTEAQMKLSMNAAMVASSHALAPVTQTNINLTSALRLVQSQLTDDASRQGFTRALQQTLDLRVADHMMISQALGMAADTLQGEFAQAGLTNEMGYIISATMQERDMRIRLAREMMQDYARTFERGARTLLGTTRQQIEYIFPYIGELRTALDSVGPESDVRKIVQAFQEAFARLDIPVAVGMPTIEDALGTDVETMKRALSAMRQAVKGARNKPSSGRITISKPGE